MLRMHIRAHRISWHRGAGRRAFTLVELLAVIAIVGILAALLSSALNQAKARGQHIACVNNLRQLQLGWILYAEDNSEVLALNRSEPTDNLSVLGRRNTVDSWVVGNPKEDLTTANVERGTIFPYVKSSSFYRCPADPSKVLVKKSMRRTRSYSASAYMNGDTAGVDPRVKARLDDIQSQSPAKIFVFVEEDFLSSWLGAFHVTPREAGVLAPATFTSVPGAWHRGGFNLSFADNHVDYWRLKTSVKIAKSGSPSLTRQSLKELSHFQDAIPQP